MTSVRGQAQAPSGLHTSLMRYRMKRAILPPFLKTGPTLHTIFAPCFFSLDTVSRRSRIAICRVLPQENFTVLD